MKVSKKRPDRPKSFGTLALVESKGGIEMHCDFHDLEQTNPAILAKIRACITGLAYMFDHDTDNIEELGQAHLDGIETGIKWLKMQQSKKDKVEPYEGSTMGFTAKLKEK